MNTPNPLVPQGTLPDKGKAQIRITVFAILAVHVVVLGVLLIAGCNKKVDTAEVPPPDATGLPPVPPTPDWPSQPTSPPPAATSQDLAQIPPVPPPPSTPTTTLPEPTPLTPPPTLPPPTVDPVLTGFTEHTISKGESFYTLGKKYNVGYKAIAEANPSINPNRLKIGDKVKIPPPRTPGAPSATTAASITGDGQKTYKVKSGDNLLKIANTFRVNVKELRAANNLRTDQIKVGQTLKIPVKPAPAQEIPPAPATPPPPTGFTTPPPQ
jgi:LysM repeat protein